MDSLQGNEVDWPLDLISSASLDFCADLFYLKFYVLYALLLKQQ
jgi:hypothetical protein